MATLIRRATAWRNWHRWLGIVACIGLLLWSFSGLGHPLMVRLQPQAANFMPPPLGEQTAELKAPADVLAQHAIDAVQHLRFLNRDGRAVYQIIPADSDQVVYLDAVTAELHNSDDADYAAWLARYYAGERTASISDIRIVEDFAGEYGPVNRLLPVYQVTFDRSDDLRVYVSTRTSRLGTLVDNNKAVFDWLFRHLHKWDWLKPVEPLRITVALFFVTAAFITAASGLYVYLLGWRTRSHSHKSLPTWHRRLSLVVALAILSFSFSGGYHLWKMWQRDVFALPAQAKLHVEARQLQVSPAELPAADWREFSLVNVGGEPAYRVFSNSHDNHRTAAHHRDSHSAHANTVAGKPEIPSHYYATVDGTELASATRQHAEELARGFSGLANETITSVRAVTRFGGEYGFVNKFLPVLRVEFATPGQERFYVEPASGRLAARVNNGDELEGWTFAYLHKWNFLDGLGNDIRDSIMALFALGHMIIAVLGIVLFFGYGRRQNR